MKRQIAVLGGSGFIGRHVLMRLAREDCSVRALTRHRENLRSLWMLPRLEVMEVDIHDRHQLEMAIAGCDAVINLAGIIRETGKETFERVHVALPQTVCGACQAVGVPRLLHMSALNADVAGPSQYLKTKGEGEAVVRASGLRWTMFQPSIVFGPGDQFLNTFARLLPYAPLLMLPSAHTRFQPVYVGDVAEAFTRALFLEEAVGRSFPLCGPQVYRLDELIRWLGRATGARRPVLSTPALLAPLQAWLLEHAPGHLMTRDNLRSMAKDSVCGDGECVRACLDILGIQVRSLETMAPRWLSPKSVSL